MKFSPIVVGSLIIEPLRYFFSNYTKQYNLVWDKDEKKRTMEIAYINDFNKIPFEEKPRILVDRGQFRIDKSGVTDNMASAKSVFETKGLDDRKNFVLYSGAANIIVEAKNQGTCELLADMVIHLFLWSRPFICSSQGFKEFGMPMSVGPCEPDSNEDTKKFRVSITMPYIHEEMWHVNNDALKIKNFIMTMTPGAT